MKVDKFKWEEMDEEEIEVSEYRKNQLISKLDEIIKNNYVPLYKVLEICKTSTETHFVIEELKKWGVMTGGTNITMPDDNYQHLYSRCKQFISNKKMELDVTLEKFRQIEKLKNDKSLESIEKQKQLKEEIFEGNMALAFWVARTKINRNLIIDNNDLEQIAYLALFETIEKFDVNRGTKFASFAVNVIRNQIYNEYSSINDRKRYMEILLIEYKKIIEEYYNRTGKKPSYDIIADIMKITVNKVKRIERYYMINYTIESVEQESQNNDGELDSILIDEPYDLEEEVLEPLFNDDLYNLLDILTDKEKQVIQMRYGFDDYSENNLREISEELGVTPERIRQIEQMAFKKLTSPSRKGFF